jgi:lipopolysaccharide transport system ATP-binding protein
MTAAIRVEGLGKCYQVKQGQERGSYRTLRESLSDLVRAPFRRRGEENNRDDFWALKDVSFEVQPGEVVGIIGRNGAGKSTLLKILSRITKPTTGRVHLKGRVGSLLEVGTGFHPELTGRENIYMNGSILGMSRKEIDRRFDEIVAFAEVEKFLDTPVKRYSSGMYVRLAFAVAAHLEPEILVVDEVLAVGDATFQRRCLDRMSELASEGRTVLLVSHNMQVLPRLCQIAILMERGRTIMQGQVDRTTQAYLQLLSEDGRDSDLSGRTHKGDGRAHFVRAEFVDAQDCPSAVHVSGEDLIIRMDVMSQENISDVALAVVIQNMAGLRVITSWTREVGFHTDLKKGLNRYECRFRNVFLRPSHTIRLGLWIASERGVIDTVENAKVIEISDSERSKYLSPSTDQGIVVCDYTWAALS